MLATSSVLNISCLLRATVLIETILAAFEMEEILYELRDHSSGRRLGRVSLVHPQQV